MPRLGSNYFRLFSASTISDPGDGVGLVAYPWLASALTRNPMLLSVVLVAQRIPWLLFSLPIGVVVDRCRRRLLMITANAGRARLTTAMALAVLVNQSSLPGPDELDDLLRTGSGLPTKPLLFGLLLLAAFLLRAGEVLHDAAAMSIMPHVVSTDDLEAHRSHSILAALDRIGHRLSLRHAISANEVLGRVNSVYRFLSFGAISLGGVLGGSMIWLAELGVFREAVLRTPFLAAAVVQLAIAVYAFGKLSGQRPAEVRHRAPAGSLP